MGVKPEDERWSKFVTEGAPDECWEWQGWRCPRGYGRFSLHRPGYRRQVVASVAALVRAGIAVPKGFYALHTCDNPPCVNPAHLYVGTKKQNAMDCSRRGRTNKPRGETHWCAKLTAAQVAEIRLRASRGEKYKRLAPEYGVHPVTISRIVRGIYRTVEKPRSIT